jgi:ribosomal protein S27AE
VVVILVSHTQLYKVGEGKDELMDEELKPCPFCGGKKITEDEEYGIYCERCGYGWQWDDFASNETVKEKWNFRPIEDALRQQLQLAWAEIQRLRAELSEYIQKEPEVKYVDRDAVVLE